MGASNRLAISVNYSERIRLTVSADGAADSEPGHFRGLRIPLCFAILAAIRLISSQVIKLRMVRPDQLVRPERQRLNAPIIRHQRQF